MNDLILRLVDLLNQIFDKKNDRPRLISEFQQIVWNVEDMGDSRESILRDLAYDLDFYEPNPETRREDASYYGHERLESEVKSVLDSFGGNRNEVNDRIIKI